MSPLSVARAVSAGRLGLGLLMMAAPARAVGPWVGRAEAQRPSVDVLTRSFGAREVLLGFLALHVADRRGVGPRTLQAIALCDATDLLVTAAARGRLPRTALPLIGPMAGGAALAQLWAARELS